MLKYTCLVLLACLNLAICFDKSISLKEYSQCKSEEVIEPGHGQFQKYVFLDSLHYGKHAGEIKVKFFFQGASNFGISLLPEAREPRHHEHILNTKISNGPIHGNSYSAIFLNAAETMSCDSVQYPNPMDEMYFTEVELVINKEYGFVAVFLPNYASSPFLKCYEPDIVSRVNFIGIAGRHQDTVRYIYDCPI